MTIAKTLVVGYEGKTAQSSGTDREVIHVAPRGRHVPVMRSCYGYGRKFQKKCIVFVYLMTRD